MSRASEGKRALALRRAGGEPCRRQPQRHGRLTTLHFLHAWYASAWCQAHAEVPCSVANGATYLSDPKSVRTRCAENSTAKALAISAPGAATTMRSAWMLSTLLVFTTSSLKYCRR